MTRSWFFPALKFPLSSILTDPKLNLDLSSSSKSFFRIPVDPTKVATQISVRLKHTMSRLVEMVEPDEDGNSKTPKALVSFVNRYLIGKGMYFPPDYLLQSEHVSMHWSMMMMMMMIWE